MKRLQTFDAVIEELGGLSACARLIDRAPPQLCYWRNHGRKFPARFYFRMAEELARLGCEAPRHLWGFVEESKQKANAA